jgi:hypothetical protein
MILSVITTDLAPAAGDEREHFSGNIGTVAVNCQLAPRHDPPREKGGDDRRAEDDPQRRTGEVAAGRNRANRAWIASSSGLDDGEVGARLTQCQRVFILHTPGMPEES